MGRNLRRNIDDRLVSIEGSATVGGRTFRFPAYDGTEATRLWFAWLRKGMQYQAHVSLSSPNELSTQLAALMAARNFLPNVTGSYSVPLQIDGDNIVGVAAARLRELGLTLQVVHVEGELDNSTKRTRERARMRAPISSRRDLRSPFLAGRKAPARNPWNYFLAERFKTAKGFRESADRKAYEDKAAADQSRYQMELSKLAQEPPRPARVFLMFRRDHPGMDMKKVSLAWANLSPQEKQVYQAKRSAELFRYRTELQEWRRLTGAEGPVMLPRRAYGFFLQDFYKASRSMYDLLSPAERKVYEDMASEGRKRYEEQESDWLAANQQAPTTAFEVFRAETSPALLQSDSSKFSGREGRRRLHRELRAQWQRLSHSDWVGYERKLQSALSLSKFES